MKNILEEETTFEVKVINYVETLMSEAGEQVDPEQVICKLADVISYKHALSSKDIGNVEHFGHFADSITGVLSDNRQKLLNVMEREELSLSNVH